VVAVVGWARESGAAAEFEAEEGLSALLEQAAVALERARLSEESAEARAAAEREQLRSALLSSISHDLRTPLATILGSVTSLRQLGDRMEPEDRADLLAAIEEETDRLSRFVGDLLLMTRLEAGLDVRREVIDVGEVIAAAAQALRRVHPRHPVRAERAVVPLAVRGDATLLGQVLFNLGDNAAKASPDGAAIDIGATLSGEEVAITVTDRGRGLSREEIRHLFEVAGTRPIGAPETGRGGLGLAIAGRVVTAMGGTIAAESRTAEVAGTRVTLRLPLASGDGVVEGEGRRS
jgi:two-component system sensor histidine kinase KdpD